MASLIRVLVTHKKRISSAVLGALWLYSTSAGAVLTDNLTIGNAKALSLGHAVTADPPGIDSIHFNPAGLVKLKGRQQHLKVVAGDFGIQLKLGDNNESRTQFLEEFQATGRLPDEKFIDPVANSTSETEGASLMLPFVGMTDIPVSIAPLGGASYSPPGSNFTVATNVYMPLGVGFFRDENDPGRYMGERIGFSLITYFSPSFAYRVTDTLSFGAAITFNYAGVGLDLAFREPNSMFQSLASIQAGCDNNLGQEDQLNRTDIADLVNLCGGQIGLYEDLGYLSFEVENMLTLGMNFGFLWEPTPWFSAGFVYQSAIDMDMEGDYTWTNSDTWQEFIVPLAEDPAFQQGAAFLSAFGLPLPTGERVSEGTASLEMEMPEHYAFGISLQVLPSFKVNMDYKFTGWSSWEGIPVKFSNDIDFLVLAEYLQPDMATRNSLTFPLGLEDGWNWAVGFEYQYNDQLALRLGVEDRPTSIPEEARSPLLPIDSGTLYAFGFNYKLEDGGDLDFGFGYFSSSVDMPGGTSRLGNSEDPLLVIYNPYSGRDIEANLDAYLIDISYSAQF